MSKTTATTLLILCQARAIRGIRRDAWGFWGVLFDLADFLSNKPEADT